MRGHNFSFNFNLYTHVQIVFLFIYIGSLRLSPCMVGTWKVPVEEKVRKDNHCPLAVDNVSLSSIL